MTKEELLSLALEALDDIGARAVLGDVIQSEDWFDRRVVWLMWAPPNAPLSHRPMPDAAANKLLHGVCGGGFLGDWHVAVVAVLLFGEWSAEPWIEEPVIAGDPASQLRWLRRQWFR